LFGFDSFDFSSRLAVYQLLLSSTIYTPCIQPWRFLLRTSHATTDINVDRRLLEAELCIAFLNIIPHTYLFDAAAFLRETNQLPWKSGVMTDLVTFDGD